MVKDERYASLCQVQADLVKLFVFLSLANFPKPKYIQFRSQKPSKPKIYLLNENTLCIPSSCVMNKFYSTLCR